ncbi:Pup--protein ligase [Corynebacterium occultum]|uniref:Pup--protein ligase n=1 Tax=Corynebacterium occultum TaxID=2675219 RepID=A0A6B8W5Z3_9CORY|nr:Pup--protein ligase [Corynebacterium occultum]QGU07397.1 Pup--protein ligase [Corynebacterium occultum]
MTAPEVFTRRIVGLETEYGITCTSQDGSRRLGPEEIARYLFRPVVEKHSSSNIFLPNSSRLYLDVGAHPEYATAECDNLLQLLAADRSGDRIFDDLAQKAERALVDEGIGGRVYLFRNNVDSAGNSYGCHENYLVGRSVVLKKLGTQLLPFLITRQLICGAGTIARAASGYKGGWVVSQRADHVWEGVSSATTRARPMINTRDEPHADSERYRRMHVIVGDSNMSEASTALKVGSMLLVLEMFEAGFDLPDMQLRNPSAHVRDIARDQTGNTLLEKVDGSTVTALEVQQTFCEAAEFWLKERPDTGTPNEVLQQVIDLWKRMLRAIHTQDFSEVDQEIDWVIKRKLLQRYQDKLGLSLDDPKLAQIDLTYHDIRPGRGLFPVLEAKGLAKRWTTEAAVEEARTLAPQTTRAALRGKFLTRADELGAPVVVDWMRLKIEQPEARSIQLDDPFNTVDDRVDELIAYMEENQGSYRKH